MLLSHICRYHGKCVGITKKMGKEMEEIGNQRATGKERLSHTIQVSLSKTKSVPKRATTFAIIFGSKTGNKTPVFLGNEWKCPKCVSEAEAVATEKQREKLTEKLKERQDVKKKLESVKKVITAQVRNFELFRF